MRCKNVNSYLIYSLITRETETCFCFCSFAQGMLVFGRVTCVPTRLLTLLAKRVFCLFSSFDRSKLHAPIKKRDTTLIISERRRIVNVFLPPDCTYMWPLNDNGPRLLFMSPATTTCVCVCVPACAHLIVSVHALNKAINYNLLRLREQAEVLTLEV